jgi:hypothetical protein
VTCELGSLPFGPPQSRTSTTQFNGDCYAVFEGSGPRVGPVSLMAPAGDVSRVSDAELGDMKEG